MLWARLYQRSISLFALCVLAVAALLPTAWSLWQTETMPWAQEICSSSVVADGTDNAPSSPTSDHAVHHGCAACFTALWAGWVHTDTSLFRSPPAAPLPPTRLAAVMAPAAVFWHVHSRAPPGLTS